MIVFNEKTVPFQDTHTAPNSYQIEIPQEKHGGASVSYLSPFPSKNTCLHHVSSAS